MLATTAHADWKDLKPGMDAKAAVQCVGVPMMENRSRGAEVWTYDRGGYVMLTGGRVACWEPSKPDSAPKPIQQARVEKPKAPLLPRSKAVAAN